MTELDIYSGFLGAGKTTLINKMLKEAYTGEKPVLIENEFGDVSIDDSLIEQPEVQVRVLSTGCICCTLRGDFLLGLEDVMREYSPSRIVIEPTGLADPRVILSACQEAGDALGLRVNSMITVVSGKSLIPLLTVGGQLFKDQLASASFVVLSRTQQMSPHEVSAAVEALREINSGCQIITAGWDELDALSLLTMAEQAYEPSESFSNVHGHSAGGYVPASFFPEKEFSPEELEEFISRIESGEFGRVLRAKGFLKSSGDGFYRLEYVYGGGDFSPFTYSGAPKLVVIGSNLNTSLLKSLLEGK